MLLLKLDTYVELLESSHGIMEEFVNPKYKDPTVGSTSGGSGIVECEARTVFKKPTRLECMMQDIAKLYSTTTRPSTGTSTNTKSDGSNNSTRYSVGYTLAPSWFCYNPCKNNAVDAIVMVQKGIPAAAPLLGKCEGCRHLCVCMCVCVGHIDTIYTTYSNIVYTLYIRNL